MAGYERPGGSGSGGWRPLRPEWLPTAAGALRRDAVTSFFVKRIDGVADGRPSSVWTVHVMTAAGSEPIELRLRFGAAEQLTAWVDRVFPGALFELLPPRVVTDTPGAQLRPARAFGRADPSGGEDGPSDAIQTIIDRLAPRDGR